MSVSGAATRLVRRPAGLSRPPAGTVGRVSDDTTTTRGTTDDLGTLVGDWLDGTACAKHLGVPVSKVRTWSREHQLAAAVPAEGAGQQVPALLVMDGVVV